MSEDEIGVDVVIENEEGSIDIQSDVLKGDKGDKGDPTATIEINQVLTGEAGTEAKIDNIGTDVNMKLNITIPRGDTGEQGEPGHTPIKGTDYFTNEEQEELQKNILSQVNQFSVEVVSELPTENINEHTIYFVPKADAEKEDVYDEFIYINTDWEHIGTTEVDLSNYYNKAELDGEIGSLNESLNNKVDKVTGKDLSTNDFTDTYKTKLDGIATGATKNTVENSLTSTSTSNALSAAQGKTLNDKYNGTTLYNNSSGTTGTITLSQTSANYGKFKITYKDLYNIYRSVEIDSPDGKSIDLLSIRNGSSAMVIYNAIITIRGTSIIWNSNKRHSLTNDEYVDESAISIVKIDGYE